MVNRVKIIWSKRAQKDLKDVYDFYESKSEKAAENVVNDILHTIENIVFEEQYQVDEILGKPYRRMVASHYRIVYRPKRSSILIFRIFDNRQNPGKLKA